MTLPWGHLLRYHIVGKFVGIPWYHGKVLGEQFPDFANRLAEALTRTSVSHALRNKRGKLIQAFLSDLFMNPLVCEDPDLSLQQGKEK